MNNLGFLPRVTAAEPLEEFRLRLAFNDGLVREVDVLHGDHEPVGPPAARASQ